MNNYEALKHSYLQDDSLTHFGVLGMKWGVRGKTVVGQSSSLLSRYKTAVKKQLVNSGGAASQRAKLLVLKDKQEQKEAAKLEKQRQRQERLSTKYFNSREDVTALRTRMTKLAEGAPKSEDPDSWRAWERNTPQGKEWRKSSEAIGKLYLRERILKR